jgi:hypothetical protein
LARADREQLHVVVDEVGQLVAQAAQLVLARPGEGERVEDDDDAALAVEVRQPHRLTVLVASSKSGAGEPISATMREASFRAGGSGAV